MTNPFSYQHEKMGAAISSLMLPDAPFEKRLLYAMNEFGLAFHHNTPSGSALAYYLKIKEIMGDGPHEERAGTLASIQRSDVVERSGNLIEQYLATTTPSRRTHDRRDLRPQVHRGEYCRGEVCYPPNRRRKGELMGHLYQRGRVWWVKYYVNGDH